MAEKKKPADPLGDFTFAPPPMAPAGTAAKRQPLGPPEQFYQEQALVRPELAGFIPYVDGDEGTPGWNLNAEDRDRLKARMYAAGLYGNSGYTSGTWNPDDAQAYKYVLESANMMGQRDANVVIDNIAAETARGSGAKGPRVQAPRAPLVSRVSNPDDIRAVLRESAYTLTGSRLSDEDEQRLIAAYQGQQAASQGAEYAAGGTGSPGGTVTQEASATNFANAQIERMRPKEVAVHRHLEAFEKILDSMGTMADETPTFKGAGLPTEQTEVL